MPSFKELYDTIYQNLHSDGTLNRKVESQLTKTVSNIFLQIMSSDEGYCANFFLQLKITKDLKNLLGLTDEILKSVFMAEWGKAPLSNHMHSDPYYQFYLFMLYYYIREKNEKLTNICLINMLVKLWNGRKKKYIPYCDKDVMTYVVNYMTSKKHGVNRYNNPLDLLQSYFTPSLLKKYQPNIEKDAKLGLKQIFEASYTRLRQIFVFNPRVDLKSGKTISTGGLRALYMKAKEDNLSIKTLSLHDRKDDESPLSFSDYITVNNLDDIIDKTINKMTMTTKPKYSDIFINNIYKDYGIKKQTIEHILKSIHDYKYKDQLNNIYSLILQLTRVISKDDICRPDFTKQINKLLKSKNNTKINELKKYNYEILNDVMKDYLKVKPLTSHSANHLIQLHKLLIRGLIYNLRSAVCV